MGKVDVSVVVLVSALLASLALWALAITQLEPPSAPIRGPLSFLSHPVAPLTDWRPRPSDGVRP